MTSTDKPIDAMLRVENLSVAYNRQDVVKHVSFSLQPGESLALIGESGSGKSTIARTILGLLPTNAHPSAGKVWFKGQDLLTLPDKALRSVRGRKIGFVPQDPQNALNPVRSIGSQAHEAARLLGLSGAAQRKQKILDTFALVGLPDPARVFDAYPHQLSGGMLQRVLIGLTVLPEPELIIADEPTSALDVTIQKRILDLLTSLQQKLHLSLLFITHDLAIAAERIDHVLVLKQGQVQENGSAHALFNTPASSYTRRLLDDVPALNPDRYKATYPRLADGAASATRPIDVHEVSKTFFVEGREVQAVQKVSFHVESGRTHALVGESGSGKTTLLRLLLGLETPDSGTISIGGELIHQDANASRSGPQTTQQLREIRRNLQLVYQNPFTSLDPTWRVRNIILEPLDRYQTDTPGDQEQRVQEAIHAVGLHESLLHRRPTELSGGQRQRVAIARALILRPKVLVLDEPTSALDVSVQAGLLDVLFKLQADYGLTYLFVSHDLSLVRQIADTVSVLQQGKLVETGSVSQILGRPQHAYTQMLINAIPQPLVARRASAESQAA